MSTTKIIKITEFLTATGAIANGTDVELQRNVNNQKLSVLVNGTDRYKAQMAIDLTKPVFVLVEDDNYDEACFTNAAEFVTAGKISIT